MSELENEFPGKVAATNLDATLPETEQVCKDLGFRNHGLVIRSPDGKNLWQQPDHEVNIADVRVALEDLLAAR